MTSVRVVENKISSARSYLGILSSYRHLSRGELESDVTLRGAIEPDLAERLVKMAGFRNILAHDYERLDSTIIEDLLRNRLGDVEQFAELAGKLVG